MAIVPGEDQVNGKFVSRMTQDGLTLAVGGTVFNAISAMQAMSDAAGQTKNSRVKALAAATAAMAAKNAASDVAANGFSVSVSLTAGHSENEQTQTTASTSHVGSILAAGNNVAITAIGGGTDSNISIVGSDLSANKNVALRAENQVNLLAAQDLDTQHSQSKSMSAAVGVAAVYSSNGSAVGITGSVSASRGTTDGEGITQLNSHIDAGNQLSIVSGGDTNIAGAVARASNITGDIKGNLNVASLQDTATFDSKDQSASVSGTYGYGASVSATFNQSKIHSDYASVQEQSGIQAGDGGFQIKVHGNTDLKGAVISNRVNGSAASSLVTGTLTHSDIANHATMEASSVGLSGSATSSGGNGDGKGQGPGGTNLMNLGPSGSAGGLQGVASASDRNGSVTRSALGAGTLVITDDSAQKELTGKGAQQSIAEISREAITGKDTSGRIASNFNPTEVQALLNVTGAFSASASRAVGDYAAEKLKEADGLRMQAVETTDPAKKAELAQRAASLEDQWKEGGIARSALHTLVGGLSGSADGALGAGVTALATPAIAEEILKLDVPKEIKSALILATGGALGSVVGGQGGAAAAVNEVENNYLSHVRTAFNKPSEQEELKKAAVQCNAGDASACKTRDDLEWMSQSRDIALAAACSHGPSAECSSAVRLAQNSGNKVTFGTNGTVSIFPISTAELVTVPKSGEGSFHEKVSKSTSEGLLLYGPYTLAWKGAVQAAEIGTSAFAAYQRASAGYSLIAASGTGAALGAGSYTLSAGLGAEFDVLSGKSGNLESAFAQRFSYPGLVAASTVGAVTGAYGTAMFKWAGVPNALTNVKTLPGAVIRVNSVAIGQSAGRAAQGAVTPPAEK